VSKELPEADIYETMEFGADNINENLKALMNKLVLSLKNSNNYESQMVAYNSLGIAYCRLFCYDKAELCHNKHLQLTYPMKSLMPLQKARAENKSEQKTALINLAYVYHAKRKFELSLQTLKMALDIAVELDNQASKARILGNMSNIYEQVYDFPSAIECQQQRYEIAANLADINGQIKAAAALGSFHQLTGEIRDAIEYYDKVVINIRMKLIKRQIDVLEGN